MTTEQLLGSIQEKQARVGIIGLGYVGLPLLLEFVEAGFSAAGFDIDRTKESAILAGKSYLKHIPAERIQHAVATNRLDATSDFSRLQDMHAIIICVPTPLNAYREPDLSYIENTAKAIMPHLQKGQLVVLESTTYPGTTEEVVRPILEQSGLVAHQDFFLAFSPEREDPNNGKYTTKTIPKVVGANHPDSLAIAQALYEQVIVKVIPVSSSQTAEATKLLENIFRCVNIALVNEMKIIFDRMGIDVWEVIKAASTKPFGFMPFYPGPGLGGHCIPIDPFYLTWKAREYEINTRFIELAGEINTAMPEYVVMKTADALNSVQKSVNGSRVLILGVAYKKDIDDVRESPSLKLIELFGKKGAEVDYHDPYISEMPNMRHYHFDKKSIELTPENLAAYDAVVIATDHSAYDWNMIAKHGQLIVDTRNALKDVSIAYPGKIWKA